MQQNSNNNNSNGHHSAIDQLKTRFAKYNQSHVFQYFDELPQDSDERKIFLEQLQSIHVETLNDIFQRSTTSNSEDTKGEADKNRIEPPRSEDVIDLHHSYSDEQRRELWSEGLKLIHESTVGVLLLAGGQGTRLGFDLPKGMFVLERLFSQSSLFQMQAERILRLQHLAREMHGREDDDEGKNIIMWYVMTSEFTHEDTVRHFEEHNFWGLKPEQVLYFMQGSMPCMDSNGAIIMESKHKVSLAPNGNGDVYRALEANGILENMRQRNVQHIHLYCVDNVLVKVADPVFIAFSARQEVDFGSKVLPKRDPHERVGVFATKGGKYHVVEYSEISREMAERRDSTTGQLAFNAGNIVNFYYTRKFLEDCAQHIKTHFVYHVAHKQIPYWDAQEGKTVTPVTKNGFKLELFNFDICEYANKVALLLVDRKSEFSPLKNKSGSPSDTPESCAQDLFSLHLNYMRDAGAIIETQEENPVCEISPMVSYAGEGLEHVKDKAFTLPLYIK